MYLKRNIVLSAIGFFLVVAALVGLYAIIYLRVDYSAINHIKQYQVSPNNFIDLAGDIGVTSAEDLGFEVKGEYNLVIHYGEQVIRVNKACLLSDEWRERASEIGIEVFTHHSEDEILYRVTYWGTAIEQWSLVT